MEPRSREKPSSRSDPMDVGSVKPFIHDSASLSSLHNVRTHLYVQCCVQSMGGCFRLSTHFRLCFTATNRNRERVICSYVWCSSIETLVSWVFRILSMNRE